MPALQAGPAPPPAFSQGACPELRPGWNRSFGASGRDFLLEVPGSGGPYAVIFVWHGANGAAAPFDELLRSPAERDGYLLVVPDGQGRFPVEWDLHGDLDLGFFDDVLACLVQQFPVDRRRVHAAGYSAGGVMAARLAERRAGQLASLVSWSGGIRDDRHRLVVGPLPRALPGLLYHGGADDRPAWVGQPGTLELAEALLAAGQRPVVCDHEQGHTIPDTDRTFLDMGAFFIAHPWGGSDPAEAGVSLPAYCQPYAP